MEALKKEPIENIVQATKEYEIISLGTNCFPRTVLTRNKIKPSKKQGELSAPFDLVKHEPKQILYYIQNDFLNYFDDIFFEERKRNIFDFRKKGLWQKKDGTKFFHDKDCKKNDKEKLIQRIKNRIENFNYLLSQDKPICFVMSLFEDFDEIEKLYEVLKNKCKNKKVILVLYCFNTTYKNYSNNIYSLNLPYPIENFRTKWNTKKFTNSKLGKYLEKAICEFTTNCAKEGLLNGN